MNMIGNDKKRRKSDSKPQIQLNKCLNEKRRREAENVYIEELAELISAACAGLSEMSAVKPDKCAILQETVKQIRIIKTQHNSDQSDADNLQASEVSSSRPTILANDVLGPLLLEALDGFLFIVNTEGTIEFVSENIQSFLRFVQSDLTGKSIYQILHPQDHPRFSSNLLPISAVYSTDSTTKSRSFNCRFRIQETDDTKYENMQISAVLMPDSKQENSLVCVARRIPPSDTTSVAVEQFTTRLDLTGKILAIDTSGVSSQYSQYLNKDIVGRQLLEQCHPNDLSRVNQHLKEALSTGTAVTSSVYRFRVATDKYVHVQTKSKLFAETVMATHSIIRDSETSPSSSRDATPSPSTSGTSLQQQQWYNQQPQQSSSSSSLYGGGASAQTFFSLSPQTQEFSLNDCLGLSEMFPSSSVSWDDNSQDVYTPPAVPPPPPPPPQSLPSAAVEEPDSNQKLRNLLTHGQSMMMSNEEKSDTILRELLDAQDDDGTTDSTSNHSDKSKNNNNNMLRMLLNDDDVGTKRKNQELLEQMLKETAAGSGQSPHLLMDTKRKSIDTSDDTTKRQQTQQQSQPPPQLAEHNPMLASMLAQTPTSVSEPIQIPTSIISQVPQENLPPNLEKRLIPAPHVTAAARVTIVTSQQITVTSPHVHRGPFLNRILTEQQFPAEQHSDPVLSSLLDDFIQMQQEMNLETRQQPQPQQQPQTPTLVQQPSDNDTMLLKILDEVIEPEPNDINARMAISAIQKQLMSYEPPPSPVNSIQQNPYATVAAAGAGYSVIPPPPSYTAVTTQYRPPQVRMPPHYLPRVPVVAQTRKTLIERRKTQIQLQDQHKRLVQQQQQQLIPQTQQTDTTFFSDNINELLNNTVAPNVTLTMKPRAVVGPPTPEQLSPRYVSSLPQSPQQQLSPGPPSVRQPYSPVQSYPSPTTYFVASPQQPHSPQQQQQQQQPNQWQQQQQQRATTAVVNQQSIQQQTNPMLNAQLSCQSSPQQQQQPLSPYATNNGQQRPFVQPMRPPQRPQQQRQTFTDQFYRQPSMIRVAPQQQSYQSYENFSFNEYRPSSSDYTRQELRAFVGGRMQQQQQQAAQHQHDTLDILSYSMEIAESDDFPMLNDTTTMSDESKPNDQQKKSLLQQLLSEPS